MRISWLLFPNLDLDDGCSYIFPTESQLSYGFGGHLLSQFGSLVDSSFHHANHFIPGSLAFQEAFSCVSKFAGALFLWLSAGPNSNLPRRFSNDSHGSKPRNSQSCTQVKHTTTRQNLAGLQFGFRSKSETATPVLFAKVASSTIRRLWKEIEQFQSYPMLSLAAALVPPFDNLSSRVLAIPLENSDGQLNRSMDQVSFEDGCRGCARFSLSNINCTRDAVEPKTGIKFPTVLYNASAGDENSCLTTEVLVGTGSRSMRVIKVKSLKLYAFGLYVHPGSVCEKLGPKYASVPISELKNRSEFYKDLLREDIHMTVRLVVNCNGLKINTVKDAFEKSLRARLQKINPNTDYCCLRAFGSYFTRDIPLPVGATIDFRKTVDGQLITEIGGKEIGSVHSKDLCRAFFDMYVGDFPVSVQAKQEIAQNVAGLMRRC